MDGEKNLQIVVTANTAEAEGALSGLEGVLGGLKTMLATLGVTLAAAAVVKFGQDSVKAAADFQSAMTLIQTQAGGSKQEVENMTKAILALAPAVGSTPMELAKGLFYVESAGYAGAKALDILKLSAEGAAVGHADLADTVKAVTSIMNSHIKGVKDATDAMGQMNAIVGAGKMTMEDLNAALSSGILASAQAFGLSLKDVGAALDTMTNAGVPAQDAATRLRMTFSLMEAPTSKAAKAMQSIGMTSREMADDMRSHGLIAALEDLHNHLEKSGADATKQAQLMSEMFGGGRTSSAMLTLVNNLDQVNSRMQQVTATTGNFKNAWETTQQDTAFQMEKMKATFESLKIEIGNGIIMVMQKLVTVFMNLVSVAQTQFKPVMDQLEDIYKRHKEDIDLLAKVLGGALYLAFVLVIETLVLMIKTLATVIEAMSQLMDWFLDVVDFIKKEFNAALKALGTNAGEMGKNFVIAGQAIVNIFNDISNAINGVISAFEKLVGKLGSNMSGTLKALHVPGFATGVQNFGGGLALVGENGAELVNLPAGSTVYNNSQTKQMLGGGVTINVTGNTVRNDNDLQSIIDAVQRAIGRQSELVRLGAL